jgi:tetratricopeptide (TPR) repeat protein
MLPITNNLFLPMQKIKSLLPPVFFLFVLLIAGCGNKEEDSPYSNIYNLPELVSISDSIRQFPKNADLYFRRSNIILTINENYDDAALYDLQKAWTLNKKAEYAAELGYLYQRKNPDSAIQFLKNVLPLFPNRVDLSYTLADAYITRKQYNAALAINDSILKTNPTNRLFLEKKANLLLDMNKKDEAIVILEKLYNSGAKYIGANLAFLFAETKNPKVLALTDEMIKSDSAMEHAEPYYFKGVYYYNIDDKLRALEFFNKAIINDKYFVDAWIEKGKTQFELNQTAISKSTFLKLIEISPDNADAFYWLGRCEEAAGNKAEAKINYQKAFALDKTMMVAKEAANRINN